MKLSRAKVQNFRILGDVEFLFSDNVTWLVGKNNTGKTSFGVVLRKFLGDEKGQHFSYNDFPIQMRPLAIVNDKGELDFSNNFIRLLLKIEYTDEDSLKNLSLFMNDLNPSANLVNIGLEATIDTEAVTSKMKNDGISFKEDEDSKKEREEFLEKNLYKFIETKIYIYDDEEDFSGKNRKNLISVDKGDIGKIIHFEAIDANRSLNSSEAKESRKNGRLGSVISEYFNSKKDDMKGLEDINELIRKTDKELDRKYSSFF